MSEEGRDRRRGRKKERMDGVGEMEGRKLGVKVWMHGMKEEENGRRAAREGV